MSIEHLKSLGIFAEVADQGSFRGAGRTLGMTPSAITYHVQLLEEAVGTPLLYRSTRKLTLTDAGARLLGAAQSMRQLAETGLQEAITGTTHLRGTLRMSLTASLLRSPISTALAEFQQVFPDVRLDLNYSDVARDLVADRFDLALRAGQLDSSALICKRVWVMPRILVAAPSLLQRLGPITAPSDLHRVPWIKHSNLHAIRQLHNPAGETVQIPQSGSLSVDNIEAMVDLAVHGMAIASPPQHYVAQYVQNGSLVEILPDWALSDIPVHAIWPAAKTENPITKAFLGILTQHIKTAT